VLQFDQARGYGFVAAEDGGEDVFLHISVFEGEPDALAPGTEVEFKVMAGDRGRKAFAAHLVGEPGGTPVPSPHPAPPAKPGPAPQPILAATAQAPGKEPEPDDEQLCEVLLPAEFLQELTDLLLESAPTLTGHQILEVRQSVLEFAIKHGWVDS
jgi:cold shock CspA family protein